MPTPLAVLNRGDRLDQLTAEFRSVMHINHWHRRTAQYQIILLALS
jgi:hypothetical protein